MTLSCIINNIIILRKRPNIFWTLTGGAASARVSVSESISGSDSPLGGTCRHLARVRVSDSDSPLGGTSARVPPW